MATKQEDGDVADSLPCVFDNGSDLSKIGFGGQDEPSSIFDTIVGRFRRMPIMIGPLAMNLPPYYVGTHAKQKRGILVMKYPVERGIITNWDDMTNLWHYSFHQELKVNPSEHNTLITETAWNPKANREKTTEIMMETFQVKGLYLAQQDILSLYAQGKTTGIVINAGDGITSVVPVHEGYAVQHAVQRMDIGGRDLTRNLQTLLNEKNYGMYSTADLEIVKSIKEELGYIALDYDQELQVPVTGEPKLAIFQEYYTTTQRADRGQIMEQVFGEDICKVIHRYLPQTAEQDFEFVSLLESVSEREYKLPDGGVIKIGNECFRAAEPLFQPHLLGFSMAGIHRLLYWSIMKCEESIRQDLYQNILLSGGTSKFRGFEPRIKKEIEKLAPSSVSVNVIAPEKRHISAWIGGSIMSTMSEFEEMCVNRSEFDDVGPSIVHRKCAV